MHKLIVERDLFGANPGNKDIAKHLFTRMYAGKSVIIVKSHGDVNGPLQKQWRKLMRKVSRQRAQTLDATKISEYTNMLVRMGTMKFSTTWPQTEERADVYVLSLHQVQTWPPEGDCRTLYAACVLSNEELYKLTTYMRTGSVVVICPLAKYNAPKPKLKPKVNRTYNQSI